MQTNAALVDHTEAFDKLCGPDIGDISVEQFNPLTGDIEGNTRRIIERIQDAKKSGVKLVILPEMAVSGYCVADNLMYDDFVIQNKKMLAEIAKHTAGITVIVGFIDYESDEVNNDGTLKKYNAAAVISDGKIIGTTSKVNLPNYRYFDDKRYFSSAKSIKPIPVNISGKVVKLGVIICEDGWDQSYDRKPVIELAEQGAELIIAINASPSGVGKVRVRDGIIRKHIEDTGLPFIYANTVGSGDNGKNIIPFDGDSLVYDKSGRLIARGKQFEEESLRFNFENNLHALTFSKVEREKEMFEATVAAVRDYAKKSGFKKAIIPLSGGIDSALALVICAVALGAENILTFNLPSKHNSNETKALASTICKNLGVHEGKIGIQSIVDEIEEIFQRENHSISSKIARENIQARTRGLLMMLESNDTGALLISCGNKTEIALGYSTLYGDMCGGVSIIGDYSKNDVYRVSRYVNSLYGKEILPEEIFNIKPSAELSENQVDPFDYSITSPLVDEFINNHRSPKELVKLFKERKLSTELWFPDEQGLSVYDKLNEETFSALAFHHFRLLRRSVYKRLQGPPIIALSESAFGFDRRESLVNAWEGKDLVSNFN